MRIPRKLPDIMDFGEILSYLHDLMDLVPGFFSTKITNNFKHAGKESSPQPKVPKNLDPKWVPERESSVVVTHDMK